MLKLAAPGCDPSKTQHKIYIFCWGGGELKLAGDLHRFVVPVWLLANPGHKDGVGRAGAKSQMGQELSLSEKKEKIIFQDGWPYGRKYRGTWGARRSLFRSPSPIFAKPNILGFCKVSPIPHVPPHWATGCLGSHAGVLIRFVIFFIRLGASSS